MNYHRRRRGGSKPQFKLEIPSQTDFTRWLLQVVEVKNKHGSEFAIEFVEESNRRYRLSNQEYQYALSIAKAEGRE